ncbi:amino acid transporter [bacterium]|nr:amino acid transporter [bacterium]
MTKTRFIQKWFMAGASEDHQHSEHTAPWWKVVCLTGVDLFSTLCYQPTIAFAAAGQLAPMATILLALVMLLAALPVYLKVANESPHGQGSISMLENRLPGWSAKLCVLLLLGFAACAYLITITLSASDGAAHFVENHEMHGAISGQGYLIVALVAALAYMTIEKSRNMMVIGCLAIAAYAALDHFAQSRLGVALIMILFLGALFLKGLREVIGVAVLLVVTFLSLSAIVVALGLHQVYLHPELIDGWWQRLLEQHHSSWTSMLFACLTVFPLLALGLSGFETGVQVMPLVKGDQHDSHAHPRGRIRNAKKLLAAAAIIMSVFLILSSLATTLLIPAKDMMPGGSADGRALSVLAHNMLGQGFGTVFDIITIAILWFAGASAMTGLINLVTHYLPRYGMVPSWARASRPVIVVFTTIAVAVTVMFKADVMAQGGAYATGVLVLITSASIAAAWCTWGKNKWQCLAFALTALLFIYTTAVNMVGHPDGPKIAGFFIFLVLATSLVSRIMRVLELRVKSVLLDDNAMLFLAEAKEANHKEIIHIVTHKFGSTTAYTIRGNEIRDRHHLGDNDQLIFLEVTIEDASEFVDEVLEVQGTIHHGNHGDHRILRCKSPSVANAISAILLHVQKEYDTRTAVHIGWSENSPLFTAFTFLFFGDGETGVLVRKIIETAESNNKHRPLVLIG